MQKFEGASPFSRFDERPYLRAFPALRGKCPGAADGGFVGCWTITGPHCGPRPATERRKKLVDRRPSSAGRASPASADMSGTCWYTVIVRDGSSWPGRYMARRGGTPISAGWDAWLSDGGALGSSFTSR